MKILNKPLVVLTALLFMTPTALAQVPAQNQALIILRILAYDRALSGRAGTSIPVAVVAREGVADSELVQSDVHAAIMELSKNASVVGRKVRVIRIPYSTPEKLEAALAQEQVLAAYLAPGLEQQLGAITQVTRRRRVLSFSGVDSYLASGVSFGIVRRGSKSAILVNLPAAKAEGADLDSRLLRVAEVVQR